MSERHLNDSNLILDNEIKKVLNSFTYLSTLQFTNKLFEKKSEIAWKDHRDQPSKHWLGTLYEAALSKRSFPNVFLKYIDIQLRYGLFAYEDISLNTLVGEYTGIVRKKKFKDRKNPYLMRYPIGFFSLRKWVIDAEKHGNYTRFINHSQNGNVQVKSLLYQGLVHMVILTTKKVLKGEQLLMDYGSLYWKQLGVNPTC